MTDEWFRTRDWSPESQVDFERRLLRARPYNRPQYLRIKGLALNAAGDVDGARALWQRVVDEGGVSWVEEASATEHLADSYRLDSPELAARLYRRVSELSPTLSGTSGTHHIKLAQLLLDIGAPDALPEVGELLRWWVENARMPFPDAHFSWNIAYVNWALALGDKESAREGARRALDLAQRGPVFPRHPTVGLVRIDNATMKWLRSLAS
jgi:tetratricopeptide (TPR) repeat protein